AAGQGWEQPTAAWPAQLTPQSVAFRHALRLALALAAGVVVYTVLALPRGFWVTVTIAFILKPSFGGTIDMAGQRVVGTLLGAMAAAVLVAAVRAPLALELLLIPITAVCLAVWR